MLKYITQEPDLKLYEFIERGLIENAESVRQEYVDYALAKYNIDPTSPSYAMTYDELFPLILNSIYSLIWPTPSINDKIGYINGIDPYLNVHEVSSDIIRYFRSIGFNDSKYFINQYSVEIIINGTLKEIELMDPDLSFKNGILSVLGNNLPIDNDENLEVKYSDQHFLNIKTNELIGKAKTYFYEKAPNYKTIEEIPAFYNYGQEQNQDLLNWFKQSGFPNSKLDSTGLTLGL